MSLLPLRAGFIPLTDAAVLIAAADGGFAAEEGVALELVREVSWANLRDRLLLGDFDAAHLLAPVAIAAALGIGYAPMPMTVPLALGLNGASIIVANALHDALLGEAKGDLADPAVSGAALRRVIAARQAAGAPKLAFAMVFPFSTHNYLLRFWMAAAGIDPDRDVQLVVVPPPYMVESLSRGHVAGFCVGAPWPSVGVAAGLGHILHFGTDIIATCPDKVVALRSDRVSAAPEAYRCLLRGLIRAAAWCAAPENHRALAEMLAAPHRLGVPAELIRYGLEGRLLVSPDGAQRSNAHYIWLDPSAIRPNPAHAAWLYAQMARWDQVPLSHPAAETAGAVYHPELYDAATAELAARGVARDSIGAFAGPDFNPADIVGYLASWEIGRKA